MRPPPWGPPLTSVPLAVRTDDVPSAYAPGATRAGGRLQGEPAGQRHARQVTNRSGGIPFRLEVEVA